MSFAVAAFAAIWFLRSAYLFRRRRSERMESIYLNESLSTPMRAIPLVAHLLGILAATFAMAFMFPTILLPVILEDGSTPPFSTATAIVVIGLLILLQWRVFGRRALDHAPDWLKEKLAERQLASRVDTDDVKNDGEGS